jgi:hypothetical protein
MRLALVCLVCACGGEPRERQAAPPLRKPIASVDDAVGRPPAHDPCSSAPEAIAPGLFAQRARLVGKPVAGEPPCVDVVRAEVARYRVRLLTATRDGLARTAPQWRETFDLAAVINAGMFHDSGAPVALLVEDGVAIGSDNPKMGGVLAFDPRSPSDPAVVITGRDCAGFDLEALRARYRSLLEAPRLLGCDGAALHWGDPKQYSAAAVGVDRAGRLVLLHARAAVTMTELARTLASPDLDLAGALFLEGGPEASLLAHGPHGDVARVGSYETGFLEADTNQDFWKLPNVLALTPR